MKNLRGFSAFGACLVLVCGQAVAAPTITVLPSSSYAMVTVTNTNPPNTNDYNIEIIAQDPGAGQSASDVTVTVTPSNGDRVRYINLSNTTGSATPSNPAARKNFRLNLLAPSSGTANVDAVEMVPASFNKKIELNTVAVKGTLGTVSAPGINAIDVVGNIVGDITLVLGDSSTSSIGTVEVRNGYMSGSIYAPYGSIGPVSSAQAIATRSTTFPFEPNGPVNIYARDTIQSVTTTTGMIWANIDANAYNSTGTLGSVSAGGDLKGSVRAKGFYGSNGGSADRVKVATDLYADITLTGAALGYQIDTGAQQKQYIRIGDSFVSGTIQVPALNANPALGGIAPLGQILVGANIASTTPAWTGTVKVGSTTLSPTPAYTPTAASIGGGAAGFPGLVVAGGRSGYDLHATSCFPLPNAVFAIRKMQLNGLEAEPECVDVSFTPRLRFYGPVERTVPSPIDTGYVASTVSVLVWNGITYTDAAGVFGTPDTVSANNYREFAVNKTGAWSVGQYRLARKDGALKCRDVDGVVSGTQDVANFALDFELVDICDLQMIQWFDRNGDQALDGADVAAQVYNPADFNLDGGADSRDMYLLLQALSRYGR